MNATARARPAPHPIPDPALDDRLAFVGTAGSGKTYNAGTAVERLLASGARVVIPDPLGVWHGLRLNADGKAPAFPVVIFGGEYADLPLTEHAGALIGEAAATMAESCIVDLSGLGTKAAERRFMLAFLTALYRKTPGDPLHVVFDEADMWAPQMLSDKEGDAAKLLGIMETIVRRGRIKGFIPWLITQRPAVLSKNVLSQADGLVAMKLTSSQDRAALGDWIEGQADRAEGKRILGEMPTLQRGQGVVWIPGRGILETAMFPRKQTFDSSRTPARGEAKRSLKLKPLDIDALKDKLSTVEAEIKASDPKSLKLEVAELKRRLAASEAKAAAPSPNAQAADAIRREAFAQGAASREPEVQAARAAGYNEALERSRQALDNMPTLTAPRIALRTEPAAVIPRARPAPATPPPPRATQPGGDVSITGPMQKILEALAFWEALAFERPTNEQVAAVAGYAVGGGAFLNPRGALKTAGFVTYPAPGCIALTAEGRAIAPLPDLTVSVRQRFASVLTGPEAKILDAMPRDGSAISNADLAAAAGYAPTGGAYLNPRGRLKALGLITYPQSGFVAVEPWVWS